MLSLWIDSLEGGLEEKVTGRGRVFLLHILTAKKFLIYCFLKESKWDRNEDNTLIKLIRSAWSSHYKRIMVAQWYSNGLVTGKSRVQSQMLLGKAMNLINKPLG